MNLSRVMETLYALSVSVGPLSVPVLVPLVLAESVVFDCECDLLICNSITVSILRRSER